MRIQSAYIVLSLGVSSVLGVRRQCGTYISEGNAQAAEAHFQTHKVAPNLPIGKFGIASANQVVDVHFHVIAQDETLEGGWIPDSQIIDQIAVLNAGYNATGLTFVLANTTRTIDEDWFTSVGPDNGSQTSMKTALRFGDAGTLNVYTVGFVTSSGLLGYSTFPWDYEDAPLDDGVVILYSSLPGGTEKLYNLGQTLTHEIGHWVGLYHTFQGGCTGTGDFVDDTPAQSSPTFGCPANRDSCSKQAGLDPIHNFMDYSDDACMWELTPGQADRLTSQLSTYRSLFN